MAVYSVISATLVSEPELFAIETTALGHSPTHLSRPVRDSCPLHMKSF